MIQDFIKDFSKEVRTGLQNLPLEEIAKAINILQACYERDGRIYVFGNGGSLAIATQWVSEINKTVFSYHVGKPGRKFQAIRLPSTEAEITAWANDVGYDMIFLGPLQNYLQDVDVVIAVSSSGNSANVIKAVEFAKANHVPVIGLSGFDGGALNALVDARIFIPSEKGAYELVESIHGTVMHLIAKYFKNYFEHVAKTK